jgi:hypothetical protein
MSRHQAHRDGPHGHTLANHARVDGFVSLGVVVSATGDALGAPLADPRSWALSSHSHPPVAWDSWRTTRTAPITDVPSPSSNEPAPS